METPIRATCPTAPDQPSTELHHRDQAEGYVAMVCFKHGPPRLLGAELEWTVHHGIDPARPLDASTLRRSLGRHAPPTIAAHQCHLALPAGSLVTVEPGGQVEISTPPTSSAAVLIARASADAQTLADLLSQDGLVLGSHGTDPHRLPNRLLQVPRYVAMQAAFDLIGPSGAQMMCSTASMQVCLDAGEASQSAARWRAAHVMGPTLVALFANSPYLAGRRTGWASSRLRATLGTCPPFTLAPEPSDDPAVQWARTAMEAPVICVRADSHSWAAPARLTFAGWIAEPARVGRPPTFEDLDYHLSTLFPPVRPKGYLEIRYLDAQAGSGWVTALALVAALMARPSTIDRVLELTESGGNRWFEAARDGLADPVLAATARNIVRLGADSLDDLDLSPGQRRLVLDDLAVRVAAIPASQRRSA